MVMPEEAAAWIVWMQTASTGKHKVTEKKD